VNEPASSPGITAPVAVKRPQRREHHGRVFVDDYEWLRDKSDPQTIAYLEAENAYTAQQTAHLEDLRHDIFAEIQHRTQESDLSVPSRTGTYWYYSRTVEGLDYPLLCRAPAAGDDWTPPALEAGAAVPGEVVLVDCNALADGSEFFSISAFSVTPDENLLAYSTDLVGNERYTIYVKDLRTGELLEDRIENTLGDATWSADGSIVFYSTVDDAWRADKVWRHTIGADAATDVVVHHEADEHFSVSMRRTTSERFLLLVSRSRITTEVRILEASDPLGDFRVLVPRSVGVEYSVEHAVIGGGDRLVVLHNTAAANFTLGVGSMDMSSLQDLETLVPPSDTVRLSDVDVSETTVAVSLRESGLPQVRVFPLTPDGIAEGSNIGFDEELFSAVATGFSDWRQPLVRLAYSSWVTPATVYEYDPATAQLHLRKRQPVLGGYDPADYVQRREWVTGRDGTRIPVSIVCSARVEPRSSAPLLL
jgi:oligopeptidase B